jgi:hypothetical protein
MKLRRFTSDGIERFSRYLDELRALPTLPPPNELLEDPVASVVIQPEVFVEQRTFPSRFEAAQYLD